ncbi:MAG: hypothetical protein KDA28_05430, partial [Phycisphaerales bacterium]|nr:hypothetical protein [Phycisphaerales bacterium]
MHIKNERRVGLLLAACGLAASPALAGPPPLVTVFTEDFESFALFPNIEEGIVTGNPQEVDEAFYGDGNDSVPFDGAWSANGWEQTFNLNGVGTAEWEGWSIAD